MKKILLILLLCACQSWATQNTIAGGKWSAASILATDTVTVTGTTSADTIDGTFTFVAYKRPASNTAAQVESGTTAITLTGTGIVWDDSGATGAKIYADSIALTSESSRMRISAGSGTITASGTALNCLGIDTLTDNKGLTVRRITIAASQKLGLNGSAAFTISSTVAPCLTIADNANFMVGANVTLTLAASGYFYTVGTGSTITYSGNRDFKFLISGSNRICSLAVHSNTTSGTTEIFQNGAGTGNIVTLMGNLTNSGTSDMYFDLTAANSSITYNANGYNISTGGALKFGTNQATSTANFQFGSGTHTIAAYTGTSYNAAGTIRDSLGSAIFNCSGSWTNGANHTVTPGTSTVKFIGALGTQAITSAGNSLYDILDSSMSTATVSTSDNLSCHSFTKATTSTGALTFAGDSVTCSGDMAIDGASSPAITFGTAVNMTGASSQFHVGSGVGTVTATGTNLYMNTATAGVIDFDKSVVFQKLYISGGVTNSGAIISTYTANDNPLNMANNSRLTANRGLIFKVLTASNLHNLGTNDTINGTANITYGVTNATAFMATFPAYTYSGTGITLLTDFAVVDGFKIQLTGAVNTGTAGLRIYKTNTKNGSFDLNGQAVTCGAFVFGNDQATGNDTLYCKASVLSVTSFSGTTYISPANIDMGSSVWNCSGSWTNGANHTMVRGTSIVRIDSTGTITSAGKNFWDFRIIGASGNKVTLADSLQCAYYYDSAGKFTQGAYSLYADSAYVNVSPDSASMGGNVYIGKSYFRNTAAVYRTAGAFYVTGTQSDMNLNGYSLGPVIFSPSSAGKLALSGGGTIDSLAMRATGGDTVQFQTLKKFTFTKKLNVRGAAGLRNNFICSNVAGKDTIDLNAKDTLRNFYIRNQYFLDTVLCKRSDSCFSGGGNY